jgi:hypothetical protein
LGLNGGLCFSYNRGMITLPKGTRLYRAIDTSPAEIDSPLKVNSEGVLWCATDSGTAATYVPTWGASGGFSFPMRPTGAVSPTNDLNQALIRQCGGEIKIYDREISIPLDKLQEQPADQVVYRDGVAKIGRPTSWSVNPGVTWPEVLGKLEELGYDTKPENGFGWLKLDKDSQGRLAIAPEKSRFQGTLLIMETTEDLHGSNRRQGDLLDPDYHQAHRMAREEAGRDFFVINDYCQTEKWGNVGHTSHAILPSGLAKLKLIAAIPALHNDWEHDMHPNTNPCPEELAWERSRVSALPPVPDLRRLPTAGAVPAGDGREAIR